MIDNLYLCSQKQMNYDSFLRFIFPDGMFDYFEMVRFNELSDKVEIYFKKKNNPPKEYLQNKFEIKGVPSRSSYVALTKLAH